MSTTTHTPGPWTMRETYDNGEPATVVIDPMQYELDSVDYDESYANARLIAAAPDLLAVLRALLDITLVIPEEVIELARAAVHKATA